MTNALAYFAEASMAEEERFETWSAQKKQKTSFQISSCHHVDEDAGLTGNATTC